MNPLGLIPGRTYTVVPVRCTEWTCRYHKECGIEAGAIGLLDDQDVQKMICKTYATGIYGREMEREVLWERIRK
jgi:hypothetical protein